jgi:hypothetical protein
MALRSLSPRDLSVEASPDPYKRAIVTAELRMLRLKQVLPNEGYFEPLNGMPP